MSWSLLCSSYCPWAQRSAFLCLSSTGIKSVCHHLPDIVVFILKIYFKLCVGGVVCACECRCLWRPERSISSLEAGVTDVRKLFMWMLETKFRSSARQYTLLISEPSLHPFVYGFLFFVLNWILTPRLASDSWQPCFGPPTAGSQAWAASVVISS